MILNQTDTMSHGNEKHFDILPLGNYGAATRMALPKVTHFPKLCIPVVDAGGLITVCGVQIASSFILACRAGRQTRMPLDVRSLNVTWWPDLR